jgi:hypothetical protein
MSSAISCTQLLSKTWNEILDIMEVFGNYLINLKQSLGTCCMAGADRVMFLKWVTSRQISVML